MVHRLKIFLLGLLAFGAMVPFAARAFSVAPGVVDVEVAAGQTSVQTLTLTNEKMEAKTLYVRTSDFTVTEEGNRPVFTFGTADSASRWIRFPANSVSIPANTKKEIQFSVTPPVGTKPGGYYAAVFVSDAPSEIVANAGAGSVQATIAALFFISVGGRGLEKIALVDFIQTGSTWSDGLWSAYSYRLQNQGDIHVVPQGTITVRDVFGRSVAVGDANPAGARVMPASSRTFEGVLVAERPSGFFNIVRAQARWFALGPVTVNLDLKPGLTPQLPIHAEVKLWILPWQLLLCVLGGIALVYGLLRALMRPRMST